MRFNFGQLLEVGDDVFLNRGVFLDTKGGVTIGDATAFAEWVAVFSHGHSEADHVVRTYAPVAIGPYVKVYAGATILPGVTVGDEAIIAARALVNRDVAPGMVVAGIPAKPVRARASEGRHGEALDAAGIAAIREPILEEYRRQSSAWYSTSEIWDDGILDPVDTRNALAIALSAALNAPGGDPHYGVFRM